MPIPVNQLTDTQPNPHALERSNERTPLTTHAFNAVSSIFSANFFQSASNLSLAAYRKIVSYPNPVDAAAPSSADSTLLQRNAMTTSAQKYLGRIDHIPTSNCFIFNNEVNDFRVLLSSEQMPKKFGERDSREYKHELEKNYQAILSGTSISNQKKMKMNCCDFCLLVLLNAGVLTREHIDSLFKIFDETSYELIIHALLPEKAIAITDQNIGDINEGDLLLVINQPEKNTTPYEHIAIKLVGNRLIHNLRRPFTFDTGVNECDFSLQEMRNVYYIPLNEVRRNVEQFIHRRNKLEMRFCEFL